MLIQLIYCSVASYLFDHQELADLLQFSRRHNAGQEITGMLLYAEGSFFQVLEGEEEKVQSLFEHIRKDKRHHSVTVIIREPVAERSFADWTMGYAHITREDLNTLIGANDFLVEEPALARLGKGRAIKLLEAFKYGHWRARISDYEVPFHKPFRVSHEMPTFSQASACERICHDKFSFAFQPIINAKTRQVFSYEALLRGPNNESPQQVLGSLAPAEMAEFDAESRMLAINLAASLGLSTHLNLNLIPSHAASSPASTIPAILRAIEKYRIRPEQIVLEILESELIEDFKLFNDALRDYRSSGLLFAIDDFGSGYAGLNLLAEFQPHMIKLDLHLVRSVHSKGPRQAIIRGLLRTCFELGIDIVAEGVESLPEYEWLRDAGIDLFQGYFFARPAFEALPDTFYLPD